MYGRVLFSLVGALAFSTATAGQAFSCGPAQVVVTAEPNEDHSQDFAASGVLTVEVQGHQTILQYRGNIDVLGATCVSDERGFPKVLFQATCTGSGCHDLDNWGIVDARSLRIELIPSDHNRSEVQRRLGGKRPCTDLVGLGGGDKLLSGQCDASS